MRWNVRRVDGGFAVGEAFLAGSAVAYSFAGFFTRLIPLDTPTLLFWRGIFAGVTILAVIVAQNGRRSLAAIRAVGGIGVAVATLSALAAWLYIAAFRHTTVADVAVIYATLPFVTAAHGLGAAGRARGLALRRRQRHRPCLGAAVMVGGAIGTAICVGDLLAFGMTRAVRPDDGADAPRAARSRCCRRWRCPASSCRS